MPEHLSRRRVPQGMGSLYRRRHASPLHRPFHKVGHAVATQECTEGRDIADEEMIAIGDPGSAFKIGGNGIADFLRQRQSNLVTPFA